MYTDIHCHIIPGIDDGARDDKMALEMLKIAVSEGTGHIFATPHYIHGNTNHDFSFIIEKCSELNKIAIKERMSLTIHSGCEVFICPELPELYDKKNINTLAGSRYMLIELPMLSIPGHINDVLYSIQLKGVVPVIAHPERYLELQKKPDILKDMVERGILCQVNSGSIMGIYGKEPQKAALKFLKMGLVHFIASDAHNNRGRSPGLMEASELIERKFGRDVMKELFINNGMKVIRNEEIVGLKSKKKV